MTWFWMNVPLAILFFLAWTLIPLWMVFKHPDTGPGVPTGDVPPPSHAAAPSIGSALASGQSMPAIPGQVADNSREEALAGHH